MKVLRDGCRRTSYSTRRIAAMAPGVVVKAGGVDLLDRLKEGLEAPPRLVNLRGIAGLDAIATATGELVLGPLATLAAIEAHADVGKRWPALAAACAHAATPQIRNMASIGGNLAQRPRCWYFRSADFHCRKKGGTSATRSTARTSSTPSSTTTICAIVHPSTISTALVAYGADRQAARQARRAHAAARAVLRAAGRGRPRARTCSAPTS